MVGSSTGEPVADGIAGSKEQGHGGGVDIDCNALFFLDIPAINSLCDAPGPFHQGKTERVPSPRLGRMFGFACFAQHPAPAERVALTPIVWNNCRFFSST